MRASRLGLALMCLMTPLPAPAQAYLMTSSPKAPATWGEWKAALQRNGQPAWVVVQDPAMPMLWTLQRTCNEEPLVETEFQVISASVEAPLGRDIRAAFGWDTARWALVDPSGGLLLSGTRIPSVTELAAQLQMAGVKSKVEQLVAFLNRHPDHLEARESLLGARLSVALRRMSRHVKPEEKDSDPSAPPALRAPLTGEEDARVWGELAAEVEQFLLTGDFLKTSGWSFIGREQASAALSPTMQGMARKCLPVVEDALRQAPSRYDLWFWWLKLAALDGGRALRPLLETLVAAPGKTQEPLPPIHVLSDYLKRTRAARQWPVIRDLLQPHWEAQRRAALEVRGLDTAGKPLEDGLGLHWETFLGVLLEAHLRLGETQAADALVNDINAWQPGSVSLPRRAAAVATACGFPDLAARWGALKVIPKS